MALNNPLGLENAIPFWAWAVSDDGLRLLLFWPGSSFDSPVGTLRFHLSDQPDAMHVLVTRSAEPPDPRPPVLLLGDQMSYKAGQQAEVNLPSALGDRPVVDATEGVARPQVASATDFWQRFWVEEGGEVDLAELGMAMFREFARTEQLRWPKQRWSYDGEDHKIIDFVAPPGSWNESRVVPITAFGPPS